jgi:hypothetical protein
MLPKLEQIAQKLARQTPVLWAAAGLEGSETATFTVGAAGGAESAACISVDWDLMAATIQR